MTPSELRSRFPGRELLGGLGALGTGTLLFGRPSAAAGIDFLDVKGIHVQITARTRLTGVGPRAMIDDRMDI
jgi:hypothetical protein